MLKDTCLQAQTCQYIPPHRNLCIWKEPITVCRWACSSWVQERNPSYIPFFRDRLIYQILISNHNLKFYIEVKNYTKHVTYPLLLIKSNKNYIPSHLTQITKCIYYKKREIWDSILITHKCVYSRLTSSIPKHYVNWTLEKHTTMSSQKFLIHVGMMWFLGPREKMDLLQL